jgi:hypothetical protein
METRRIQGTAILAILLVLSFGVLACGGDGDDGGTQTTKPSAVETTEAGGTGSSVAGDQTTSSLPGEETTVQVSSTAAGNAPTGDASSYRIHTVWRDGTSEGAITSQWDTEYASDPLSVHHKAEGDMSMEIIFIGQTLWTKIMDQPWQEMELPEGDTSDLESMLAQTEQMMDVEEQTPLQSEAKWLMGQSEVKIAEGGLTLAGEETVNGVACKRYTVDSAYSYGVKMPEPINMSTITEDTQGEIWVANDGGFVVRARLLQTTTTKVEGGPSSSEAVYIEEDVTDVNSSDIVIEPPK